MLFVALLRSVGIPARHCMMSWKYNLNDRHFYCEYWDAQLHRWVALDSSDNQPISGTRTPQEKTKSGNWNSLGLYAHPGFTGLRDIYDTDCFDGCLNVSENVCGTYSCTLETKKGLAGRSTAYVWNLQNWRPIAGVPAKGDGSLAGIVLADTSRVERPVLFTVIKDNQLWWGLRRPSPASDAILLERAEAGRCLQWHDYEDP
jgi:transglutaminase-like putative cysteine protease